MLPLLCYFLVGDAGDSVSIVVRGHGYLFRVATKVDTEEGVFGEKIHPGFRRMLRTIRQHKPVFAADVQAKFELAPLVESMQVRIPLLLMIGCDTMSERSKSTAGALDAQIVSDRFHEYSPPVVAGYVGPVELRASRAPRDQMDYIRHFAVQSSVREIETLVKQTAAIRAADRSLVPGHASHSDVFRRSWTHYNGFGPQTEFLLLRTPPHKHA